MPVPETAMHENHLAPPPENQIGTAWQPLVVQSVAIAHAVCHSAHNHFRFCVFGAYPAHVPATFQHCQSISHGMYDFRRYLTHCRAYRELFMCYIASYFLRSIMRAQGGFAAHRLPFPM